MANRHFVSRPVCFWLPAVSCQRSSARLRQIATVMLGLLTILLTSGVQTVRAQQSTPNIILEIEVQGTEQIGKGEILSHVSSRAGLPLDVRQVTQDIKNVYALGFFEDVKAQAQEVKGKGYNLIFVVQEKPRIASLKLVGATLIDTKKVLEGLPLKAGGFFSKTLLEDDLDAIRAAYRAKGYLKVKVTDELKPGEENTFHLVLHVEESARYYITDIRVYHTKVFSELQIQRMMSSAEVDCFDWVDDSGVFDEMKINHDLQVIVARYLTLGYIRVFIAKPKVTLIHNPEYTKIKVELDISEGNQYFTGKVDISGDILGEKDKLLDQLGLKPGDVYNPLQQNQDVFHLNEIYQEQGYAFVRVVPEVKINDETRIADVTYNITKGEKAYIGRIEFQGNRETRDYVLRREFQVREDELYNGRKLRVSQRNLMALGYFKPSLRMTTQPAAVNNILNVVTKVEEAQTGTLQGQLGFSDQSGMVVSFSISKGNFLGRGQTLRLSAQWAQKDVTRDFSASFIEPYLLGTDFSSETSAAYRSLQDQSELKRGNITEVQGSQGFGHPLYGPFRLNLSLSATNRTFENKDTPAVQLRTFTTALIYNTVNNPVFPSAGTSVTTAISQVGGQILRGTTEYRRYRMRYQHFTSLNRAGTVVFMGRLRLGWLEQVGDNEIPAEDRFRLGGISSLRGYNFSEVGGPFGRLEQQRNTVQQVQLNDLGLPVLDASGNPVLINVDKRLLGLSEADLAKLKGGGISERLLNLELLFPLAGDNVRGVVFYDAGQVNAENDQYQILHEKKPGFFDVLQSVGVGVRLITPMGVFRFEYGSKLNPGKGESPDKFDFTISTLF